MSSFQQTGRAHLPSSLRGESLPAVVDFYQVINPPSSPSLPGDSIFLSVLSSNSILIYRI